MKKVILFFVLLFCTSVFADDLPRIAVYVTGGQDIAVNRALATRLLEAFVNSERYAAIERTDAFMAEIDREQVKQRSGAVDDAQISRLGRQSGVQFVCVADITPVFGNYQVSARIINVETAAVSAIGVSDSPLKTIDDLRMVSKSIVAAMFGGNADESATGHKNLAGMGTQATAPADTPSVATTTPPLPATYTLTTAAEPSAGGRIKRFPEWSNFDHGAQVVVTAVPHRKYHFVEWSGALTSTSITDTLSMDDNLTLTARFTKKPKKKASPLKASLRIATPIIAVGALIGGSAVENKAEYMDYNYRNARDVQSMEKHREQRDSRAATANLLYVLGGLGVGGFTVTFFIK